MHSHWTREIIEELGEKRIWTAVWQTGYSQHFRYCQRFQDAERLAREHSGQVILWIRDYARDPVFPNLAPPG